jgi:hypothetical protein
MAMPPDGSSPWRHSSDTLRLRDPDGALWAMVTLPLERDRLGLVIPFAGQVNDSFYVFEVRVSPAGVTWIDHDPALAAPRELAWTRATPASDLVVEGTIRARPRWGAPAADAPVVAHLAAADGEVRVSDGHGRCRLVVALVGADGPVAGAAGTLVFDGHARLWYALPTDDGCWVETVATSLP